MFHSFILAYVTKVFPWVSPTKILCVSLMSCLHATCPSVSASSHWALLMVFREVYELQSHSLLMRHIGSYLKLLVQFKISHRRVEYKGNTPLTRLPHERSRLWRGTARATRSVPVRTRAGALRDTYCDLRAISDSYIVVFCDVTSPWNLNLLTCCQHAPPKWDYTVSHPWRLQRSHLPTVTHF